MSVALTAPFAPPSAGPPLGLGLGLTAPDAGALLAWFRSLDWGLVTRLVIAGAPALVALYDVLIYNTAGNDATISKVLLSHSAVWPVLALAVAYTAGVLSGHFFVPQHVAA